MTQTPIRIQRVIKPLDLSGEHRRHLKRVTTVSGPKFQISQPLWVSDFWLGDAQMEKSAQIFLNPKHLQLKYLWL